MIFKLGALVIRTRPGFMWGCVGLGLMNCSHSEQLRGTRAVMVLFELGTLSKFLAGAGLKGEVYSKYSEEAARASLYGLDRL